MAKKSFIDRGNPAMQFISGAREEHGKEEVRSERSAEKKSRRAKTEKAPERERRETQAAPSGQSEQAAQAAQSARSVRQTAGENVAAAVEDTAVLAAENGSAREQAGTAVRSHPVAPRRQGESKSKRVQLLVPPSLHMRASRRAAEMELSFNEYVNQLLEKSCGE